MSIGARARIWDWDQRTTGATTFVPDIRMEGMLTAAVVRSPYPHADVLGVDVGPALAVPGVVSAITAKDFGEARYLHLGGTFADRTPLAVDRVRFVGEEVAAVAAETPLAAEVGAAAVKVRYRPRRAVTEPAAALRRGAPSLHARTAGRNVAARIARSYGDVRDVVSPGPEMVSTTATYRFARQSQVPMEPAGVVARWNARTARLHVWPSTQAPYFVRKELAAVLDLGIDQVVIHEVAVGGGFGGKAKVGEHEALAARLSMLSGRPVRLVLSRWEEFATTKPRHDFQVQLTTVAADDGRLVGRDADVVVDNGAYNATGPSVMGTGVSILASLYHTEGVRVRARLVDTNKAPGGSFRGYGVPQVTFAMESQMDELADLLGADPIELRLRNLPSEEEVTHAGYKLASSTLSECLETARREIGWDEARRPGSGVGVGIAVAMHVSGAHAYEGSDRSGATVDIHADGGVTVRFGGSDTGTGQRGVLAQVAAAELGVALDRVRTEMMDSERTPTDLGSWSSRGTVMATGATRAAALRAATILRDLAAEKLGCRPEDVILAEDHARLADEAIPIGDLVSFGVADAVLSVTEEFETDTAPVDPEDGIADVSMAYSFAAHAVKLVVDDDTGQIRILDYVAVHDCGQPINPTAVEGQIVGGVVMGIGAALTEELRYEAGRLINPSYLHYLIPRSADVPLIRPVILEPRGSRAPYGVKSVGEICINPVAPAIANAVAHATGIRIRELPLTPEKILGSRIRTSGWQRTRRFALWRRPDRWWIALLRWSYPRGVHALLHRYGTRLARPAPIPRIEHLAQPTSLGEALDALTEPTAIPLAGGTDVLAAPRTDGRSKERAFVDLSGVPEFQRLEVLESGELWIGAGVTLHDLEAAAGGLRVPVFAEAISTIASEQVRRSATVGGNLLQEKRCWFFRNGFECYKRGGSTCPCYAVDGDNRFHHAIAGAHRCQAVTPSDLATVFQALDATVHLVGGRDGSRDLRMADFFTGPGETVLEAPEIVTGVSLSASAIRRTTIFQKMALAAGDFAVASACVSAARDGDRLVAANVVLGGIAPTPMSLPTVAMKWLEGEEDDVVLSRSWLTAAHPLVGNEWKVEAACGVLARAIRRCREAHLRQAP